MTLPHIEPDAVEAFWRQYLASSEVSDDTQYSDVFHFGDHPELADELLELVVCGRKRATASGLAELDAADLPVPRVGDRWVVCDGQSRPRLVGLTTEIRIGPLQSVDDAFAWDEGEGDRTRADWLHQHEAFFRRTYTAAGLDYHDNIDVVFERFDVVYQATT